MLTTMSSTVSTVRSAVLNGVFSGTRSMPKRMSVIFIGSPCLMGAGVRAGSAGCWSCGRRRSEEHTSELQSLMRISYAVFCLKKKKKEKQIIHMIQYEH